MIQVSTVADRLRSSLWFIPSLFAAGAFLLAAVTLTIDRNIDPQDPTFFIFGGTAEGARSVLATIAQSMLTFTALVFTITMLVLQLASSQLSPRVMRTFLRDRNNQVVLGLFVATFVYTLLVLRDVRSPDGGAEFVPGLSIFAAFLMLVASVAAFIHYINHMAHAIRASAVIDSIAEETRSAINRLFPETVGREADDSPAYLPRPSEADRIVTASHWGTLVNVDVDGLLEVARDSDLFVQVFPMVGDFVPEGAPLFRVARDAQDGAPVEVDEELADRLRRLTTLESERTLQQDAAFGFRQIVDVGVRALSPGTNDPSTAVQAIDRIHDLLRRLATRSFPTVVRADEDGRLRAAIPRPGWEDYVSLAVDELRIFGSGQIQVMRRLRAMLNDLLTVAPAGRDRVLQEQLDALDAGVNRNFETRHDRDEARRPSASGHTPS